MADQEFQEALVGAAENDGTVEAPEPQTVEIDGVEHELADFTQADLWEQMAERRRAGMTNPTPDVSWEDMIPKSESVPEAGTDVPETGTRAAQKKTPKQEESEEEEAPKEIKKPWGRIRRLEKERNAAIRAADDKIAALETKLERALALLERQANPQTEEEVELPPDPNIAPVQAIMHELKETREKLERLEQEKQFERQKAEATYAVNQIDSQLNIEIQNDPVFKRAFEHVTRVVRANAIEREDLGATPKERLLNAFSQLLAKEIEWYKQGKNPVEEVYRQAIKFGFDPDEEMKKLGGTYDENGAWVTIGEDDTERPAQKARPTKTQSPLEKIQQARKRREGTGSIANVVGRPVKNFSAKQLAGKTDKETIYAVKKAMDQGDLSKNKKNAFPSLAELLEGTDALFDDGR